MRAKVLEATRALRLDAEMRTLESSGLSAPEVAAAVGCEPAQIAGSTVFVADGEPVLCLASSADQVDVDLLCEALDCAVARPAAADEVRAATGFAAEGVPPLAHGVPVVLDERLLEHARVWAAGGDGHTLLGLDPRALAESSGARVARIAAPPPGAGP